VPVRLSDKKSSKGKVFGNKEGRAIRGGAKKRIR
jgi:hypothetical protein